MADQLKDVTGAVERSTDLAGAVSQGAADYLLRTTREAAERLRERVVNTDGSPATP